MSKDKYTRMVLAIESGKPDPTLVTFPDEENSAVIHLSESELNTLSGILQFALTVCETVPEYENMKRWHGLQAQKDVLPKIVSALGACRSREKDGSCYFLDEWLTDLVLDAINYRYDVDELIGAKS